MVTSKGFPRPKTIMDYIAASPVQTQDKLYEILACIRKVAPGAEESIKWNMPAFSYKRILVTFAAFKHHIGFYPTPSVIKAFEKQLLKFKTAVSSVQFPLDKPLPIDLIKKMTELRVKESIEEDGRWRV